MQKYSKICLLLFSFSLLVLFSCEKKSIPVQFYIDSRFENALYTKSRAAAEGTLDFSKPQKLEYFFPDNFVFPSDSSLVLEYDFGLLSSDETLVNFYLVLDMGDISWELPLAAHRIQYAVPVKDSFNGSFSLSLEGAGKINKDDAPVFHLRSLLINNRWFGFYNAVDEYYRCTPFLYIGDDNSYVIDVPLSFLPQGRSVEIFSVFFRNGTLETNSRRIETFPGVKNIYIPPQYPFSGQTSLSGEGITVFTLNVINKPLAFPNPIEADPALVINWPRGNWRNSQYEVFRWRDFQDILIFDFADYAAQDRMLKRLAFFVEKAGFRGRLAHDHEIAELHGWNAHDYRAVDLAHFFDTAHKTDFPLLKEERELEKILLNEGIIIGGEDGFSPGTGGIISISRESAEYLRYQFMAHEGYHGLFFIDEDFRDFSRRRWEQLSPSAKRAITSFFEFQQYDTRDEYLLVNEFMAHILQQSVSQAAFYFGSNIPSRLESTWRASALPQKDEDSGTWPTLASAFSAEAQAFSNYVNNRWSLAAGRVWSLRVNDGR